MPLFHNFRSRLLAGETLIGTFASFSSPESAEILADAGYDWILFDAEHAPFEPAQVQTLVQAIDHQCPCFMRIPTGDEAHIKKALDIGLAGIMVPQVNTPEQAEQIIRLSKYPPQGTRGVGLARAHRYGYCFQDYLEQANDEITIILQAEHIQAVENIRKIVEVPGIDAILVGPYDLSASMGKPGQVNHPEVIAAIELVTAACKDADISLGIFGLSDEAVSPYMEQGFNLIAVGVDAVFLGTAARDTLGKLRS